MTARVVAAIALAISAMAMMAALTGVAARAESIGITPALAKVIGAAKQDGTVTILHRAYPGIDQDNQKPAKLLRET